MADKTIEIMNFFSGLFFFFTSLTLSNNIHVQEYSGKIIVSQNGKGDFETIQSAINSLRDSSEKDRVIYILNGVYDEKVLITKNHVVLEGESMEKTIITQSIARDEWRCANKDDWGVASINIDANDITLKNLSVVNSYGYDHNEDNIIFCATDSSNRKIVRKNSHQMALRSMSATRFKAIHCRFSSFAGDTVSPWNVDSGMFYFKDCIMEGGVDLYCPRGWAFAEGCKFYANVGDAVLWHDGSKHSDSKTVLLNCFFDGYKGFRLGRFHKDAQFYLISCNFSSNMANMPIYLVPTTNVINLGKRIYFFNCHKDGGDYAWFMDNLNTSAEKINPLKINSQWVFGNHWDPFLN
jgi:pectinesterase